MDSFSKRFNEHHVRRHFAALLSPGHCVEIRFLEAQFDRRNIVPAQQFSKTLGGWFNNPNSAVVALARAIGVSAYFTVNPVIPELLSRADNQVVILKKGMPTTADSIHRFRRWFIDIDAIRHAASGVIIKGISATDAERQHAIDTRDRILADYPDIRENAVWGTSGNGAWILVTIADFPVDKLHQTLIERALKRLQLEYGSAHVEIDSTTANPSRIMPVSGTLKCKGSPTPDRPHRLTTFDSPPDHAPGLFDLLDWLGPDVVGEVQEIEVKKNYIHRVTTAPQPAHIVAPRAAAYLAAMKPAISGQKGHSQTFDAACALVKGFNLAPSDALPFLQAWNAKCVPPWDLPDLLHKLESADQKADDKPRGYLLTESGSDQYPPTAPQHFDFSDTSPPPDSGPAPAEAPPERSYSTWLDIAHNIIEDHYSHPDNHRIRFWNDDVYVWDGYSYRQIRRAEIEAKFGKLIQKQFIQEYTRKMAEFYTAKDEKATPPKLRSAGMSVTRDVLHMAKGVTLMELSDYPSQPAWLIDHEWKPTDILPTRNALIHLPSLIDGKQASIPLTPNFFGLYSLNYSFDSDAPSPVQWLAFLDSLWPDDPDSIALLQEWMGYLLTPDTSHQKIGMMIGPPRSGKGTIARVITALMGRNNVVFPTFASLAESFGAAPLLGKQVAIVTDARISGRTDSQVIVERLLSISGEDAQTVHRKYKDEITTKLDCRFMIISNELPNIKDSSGALASRMLIMQLRNSFLHKEDRFLFSRLVSELPGILRWAITGWARLQTNRVFTIPESAKETAAAYTEFSSPILKFIKERCMLGDSFAVPIDLLYKAWCNWCSHNGREHPGESEQFGRALRSAIPGLATCRPRLEGVRINHYRGIRLLTPEEIFDVDQLPVQRFDFNLVSDN